MENSGGPGYSLYSPVTIAATKVDDRREKNDLLRISKGEEQSITELFCPYKGCPKSMSGHGFLRMDSTERKAEAAWQAHIELCVFNPMVACRCLVEEVEQALANYYKGLLDQIEQSLLDGIVQAEVPFADADHSACDICKKPVLAISATDVSDDFQARNRIRLALANHKTGGPASNIYKPLNLKKPQIRLVLLSVSSNEFVLENFDWDDAPPFIAISYTWGAPTPSYTILVNGQPFQVRDNLRNFLRTAAVRNAARRRAGVGNAADKWLWIDQICIDQSNTEERNHQVQMMSRIYGSCKGVVVWLGCDGVLQNAISKLAYVSDFDALATVLRSPYFSRIWIIQEILLNPTKPFLLCGDTELPWEHVTFFTKINGWVDELLRRHVPSSSIFLIAEAVQRRTKEKRALTTCVYYYSSSLCTNPRDKVYGFLGLIDEAYAPAVDYNKSVLEVFHDAVIAMVRAPRDPRPLEVVEDNTMLSAIWELGRMIGIAQEDLPSRRFIVELEKLGKTGLELDNGAYSAGQLTRIGYAAFNPSNIAHRYGKNYGWWFEYGRKQKTWRVYHNGRGRSYNTSWAQSSTQVLQSDRES